ncbi:hypothetical protein HanRHA438_Chr06g0264671 [Helianthus annuus]|nr:hypothetical protein HanHA300_Chr06g0209651 [Helianthus annuus]KAJ0573284.1 hypothetical protein HanHA89_Chr06g0225041 [Helianthus annuus]KAJ0911577.1 hypothetical protein HanRHA438_Chr06g0264671 [Helianthus annuus]
MERGRGKDLTRTVTVLTRIVDGSSVVRFLQKLQPVEAAVSPTPPPRHPQSLKIGTISQLLSGGIAGAFSKTCTASLVRLTYSVSARRL